MKVNCDFAKALPCRADHLIIDLHQVYTDITKHYKDDIFNLSSSSLKFTIFLIYYRTCSANAKAYLKYSVIFISGFCCDKS